MVAYTQEKFDNYVVDFKGFLCYGMNEVCYDILNYTKSVNVVQNRSPRNAYFAGFHLIDFRNVEESAGKDFEMQ